MDTSRFLRVRNAARETLGAAGTNVGPEIELADIYRELVSEVRTCLSDDMLDEFDRLFRTGDTTRETFGNNGLTRSTLLAQVRARLGELCGWLDGVVEAAERQMRVTIEAEAYARERVKEERRIGFAPSTAGA